MNNVTYAKTLAAPSEAEYQEKGSRFLAYAFPCQDAEEFAQGLAKIRLAHPKARHHCFAYRLGELGAQYRAYDDGEPSGTAGLPIFNQLQSFEVSDAGIVVVRYFGGTLLGASGLIRAYKTAAQQALAQANLLQIVPKTRFSVQLPYAEVHKVMQCVERFSLQIVEQSFEMESTFLLEAERDVLPAIMAAFEQQQIEVVLEES